MSDSTPIKEFLRCQGEFMAYLMAILRDFDAAEEVFQNAAVVIVEGGAKSEPIRNFRAWAKEVVRRQALYRLRKDAQDARRHRPVTPELFDAITSAFMEEPSLDDRADESLGATREIRALRGCLQKLSDRQRELLARRYERRQSFAEIGTAVSSTAGAVQRAISRIRMNLYDCVQASLRSTVD
jgi:RNA polymerase sigma-70 factor (ECF subfamily)